MALEVERPEREEKPRRIECEFCGCELTPSGEVRSLSNRARTWRWFDDDDQKKMQSDLKARETRIAELEAELEALKAAPSGPGPDDNDWLAD